MTDPTILTPGEPAAAPVRKKPGPKPRVQAAAPAAGEGGHDVDLDDYDSDELPPQPAVNPRPVLFSPEQQAEVQRMIADAVAASRSAQDPATAAKLAAKRLEGERLPTVAAAAAVCADAVSKGLRPRAVLTSEGWYVHPEMGRTKANAIEGGIL